jgi:hypothetical protein
MDQHRWILALSRISHEDLNQCVFEWRFTGKSHGDGGRCELCGNTNLIYLFEHVNLIDKRLMWFGSECSEHFPASEAVAIARRQLEARQVDSLLALIDLSATKNPFVERNKDDFKNRLRRFKTLPDKVMTILNQYRVVQ